jgi:hypothetical protein
MLEGAEEVAVGKEQMVKLKFKTLDEVPEIFEKVSMTLAVSRA